MENNSNSVHETGKCTNCGVPEYLHGTCCGWLNAAYCIEPRNEEEKEYKKQWETAHPGVVIGHGQSVYVVTEATALKKLEVLNGTLMALKDRIGVTDTITHTAVCDKIKSLLTEI